MVREGVIFGMGNPLLDISAHVPQSVFDKYGVKVNTAIIAEEKHLPVYSELVDHYDVTYIAGGAAQNTMRVAQWMIQNPPRACTYVGSVGKDKFAEELESAARSCMVNVQYMKLDDPTGTCAVLVDEKRDRALIANISAAGKFQPSFLADPAIAALVAAAQVFYVEGYFLTVSVPAILDLAKHSLAHGKTFCLNLSAPFLSQFFFPALMEVMPYVDILFANESEADAFAKANKWEASDLAAIAALAQALPRAEGAARPRTVVFTHGDRPTTVASSQSCTTYPVPPSLPPK